MRWGYTRIIDRKKDMILVSGFNVFPNELEQVISLCPGVVECAAIGVPDEKQGEGHQGVHHQERPALTEDDVAAFCHENLTGYKRPEVHRVPRRSAQDQRGQDLAAGAA